MNGDYAIETRQLTKIFSSGWRRRPVRAVDGISIQIHRGTTFGFLGPNGAGKTTFVKLLLSAVHPSSGTASLFGRDSRLPEARRAVGYLPENHRFPTYFTGAGLLDFYASLSGMERTRRRRRVRELLELVGLGQWGGVRIGKYSKGMLQRLGLAQALMHSPDLLILDEPSDGVDPLGRRRIREILHELELKGVTIFINSHLLAEVEMFCREVAILHQGKLALIGNVKDLTAGSGYKLAASGVSERLIATLRAKASRVAVENGSAEFLFSTRELANAAIDLLRAEGCPIESLSISSSTLEEVFMRTVNA